MEDRKLLQGTVAPAQLAKPGDDRARVDTTAAQAWIRETIAEVLQR